MTTAYEKSCGQGSFIPSGTAFALETAKRLLGRGVEVQRVFLAAPTVG